MWITRCVGTTEEFTHLKAIYEGQEEEVQEQNFYVLKMGAGGEKKSFGKVHSKQLTLIIPVGESHGKQMEEI